MNKKFQTVNQAGDGVYRMTRKQAGETVRAAKAVKGPDATYWHRKRGKGTK